MTNWFKISEKTPNFNKEVIVKTSKHAYFIASLSSIVSDVGGINYYWNIKLDDDDKDKIYGKIVEWCEIPN